MPALAAVGCMPPLPAAVVVELAGWPALAEPGTAGALGPAGPALELVVLPAEPALSEPPLGRAAVVCVALLPLMAAGDSPAGALEHAETTKHNAEDNWTVR
jgi:hypothetical protein